MATSTERTRRADFVALVRRKALDWAWPTAVAAIAAIVCAGDVDGAYAVGSMAYHANTSGLPVALCLSAFAGVRWRSLGRAESTRVARSNGRLVARAVELPGLVMIALPLWVVTRVALASIPGFGLDD